MRKSLVPFGGSIQNLQRVPRPIYIGVPPPPPPPTPQPRSRLVRGMATHHYGEITILDYFDKVLKFFDGIVLT